MDVDADAGADATDEPEADEPAIEALVASLPGSALELVVELSAHADTIRTAPNTSPTADDARRMFIP